MWNTFERCPFTHHWNLNMLQIPLRRICQLIQKTACNRMVLVFHSIVLKQLNLVCHVCNVYIERSFVSFFVIDKWFLAQMNIIVCILLTLWYWLLEFPWSSCQSKLWKLLNYQIANSPSLCPSSYSWSFALHLQRYSVFKFAERISNKELILFI